MPRTCLIDGMDAYDPDTKRQLLLTLKSKIEELEQTRSVAPVTPRLHTTGAVCQCGKQKDPLAGKQVIERPLQTLVGEPAYPQRLPKPCTTDWYPPKLSLARAPHKYMHMHPSHGDPPTRRCSGHPDCQFGTHLDSSPQVHECCYIECECDKPGFRDWRPKHICNYPNSCKAGCFNHFSGSDYYSFHPFYEPDGKV